MGNSGFSSVDHCKHLVVSFLAHCICIQGTVRIVWYRMFSEWNGSVIGLAISLRRRRITGV